MAAIYEANTKSDTFRGTAIAVARVAVAWKKAGRDVAAYAIGRDAQDRVTTRQVPVNGVKATAAALRAAI